MSKDTKIIIICAAILLVAVEITELAFRYDLKKNMTYGRCTCDTKRI